jgi:hypothetical protein
MALKILRSRKMADTGSKNTGETGKYCKNHAQNRKKGWTSLSEWRILISTSKGMQTLSKSASPFSMHKHLQNFRERPKKFSFFLALKGCE